MSDAADTSSAKKRSGRSGTSEWNSGRVFGWLYSDDDQWRGRIGKLDGRPALWYSRPGEKHQNKRYAFYLDELAESVVSKGWIWCAVTLTSADSRSIILDGLSSNVAEQFVLELEAVATEFASSSLAAYREEISGFAAEIARFSVPHGQSPYQAISAFVDGLRPEIEKTKAAALAALKRARAAEPIGQESVGDICASVDRSLNDLTKRGIDDLSERLVASVVALAPFLSQVASFKAQDRYLRHSKIVRFTDELASCSDEAVRLALAQATHPYAAEVPKQRHQVLGACTLIRKSSDAADDSYRNRNELFVEAEKRRGNAVLSKLNEEQQTAAIVFEDRNLLVAAAGSGKSWTLIGKAGYALTRGLFAPADIVALAFNSDAADELNVKINRELRPHLGKANVRAHTFHALGLAILRKRARQQKQRVKVFGSCRKGQVAQATKDASERQLLEGIVGKLAASDGRFLANWTTFRTLCRQPSPRNDAFATYQDYVDYVEEQRKARRAGEPAFLQALDGTTVVKSVEELAIANWLWMHQVPYAYERDFTPKPPGWKTFNPDFYFPQIDTWLEHFGLDEYGQAPSHFNDPVWYAEQAKRKQAWFEDKAAGRWFCTSSADYRSGRLFHKLREELVGRGVTPSARSQADVEEKIKTLRQVDEISLISRCLHIVRGNGYGREEFAERALASPDPYRSRTFADVFWPIHDAYVAALKDRGEVDFDDMIIKAAEALEAGDVKLPYKLIMVDEFQDLSPGRARLVKALLRQHAADSILFAVGDDWQAINGFAGSDLKLFMEFESVFGKTWEGPLSTTFRCSQGIADVSSWFVMENGYQKKKTVKADSNGDTKGAVHLLDVSKDDSKTKGTMAEIDRMLDEIALRQASDAPGRKASVYLLGRYRLENTPSLSRDWLNSLNRKHAGILDIAYKTVHSSKGLEADYVFCVGLNRNKHYNFPSTFETDPLVDMLLSQQDAFPFAEERRLFYVALTRARRKVFLLFQRNAASPFVVDLMAPRYKGRVQYGSEAALPERCGGCHQGYLLKRPKKDRPGHIWGCSRYIGDRPDSCTYWKPHTG